MNNKQPNNKPVKNSSLSRKADSEKVQKLNKNIEILTKSRDSEVKKYNVMKVKFEKEMKELKDK